MNNPISEKARGVIYVVAIVISGLGLVTAAVAPLIGLGAYTEIISGVVAAVGLVAQTLARANLNSPVIGMTEEQVDAAAAQVWETYKNRYQVEAVTSEQAAQEG